MKKGDKKEKLRQLNKVLKKKKKKFFHPKRVMSQRINRDGQSVVLYFFDLIKERERERNH